MGRRAAASGVGEATSNGVGAAPAMSNDIGVRALGRCVSGDGGWSQTRGKGGDEAVRRGGGVREVVARRGGDVGGWRGGDRGVGRRGGFLPPIPIWTGEWERDVGEEWGSCGSSGGGPG